MVLSGPLACGGRSESRTAGDDDDDAGSGGTEVVAGNGGRSGSGGGSGARGGSGGRNGSGGGDSGGSGGAGSGGSSGGSSGGFGGGAGSPSGGSAGAGSRLPDAPLVGNESDRLDLLFMIDGSIAMAEKQSLLAEAIPRLLGALAESAYDIHLGVVSSNLGHHGSHDICSDATGERAPDDRAQLIASVRSDVPGNASGFLDWGLGSETSAVAADVAAQVRSVGELGCGYEGQLEAWYRFLVDPEPVLQMDNDGISSVRTKGADGRTLVNEVVLAQRAAFLRLDSVVAIVMLSDENDCSIMDEDSGQSWLVSYKGGVTVNNWRMPAATASCKNPNDPCCRPCIVPPAAGCADNAAEGCPETGYLDLAHDAMNQRCFQQRQRFGIDLLYPVSRYVEALTKRELEPRLGNGTVAPNPLFAGPRGRDHVLFAGIVGVPWQDVASEDSLLDPRALRFLDASELSAEGRWEVILGDPANGVQPTDPLMIESIDPRPTGSQHPLVEGGAIAGPDETELTNVINGHEQRPDPQIREDLQFACIFPLREPVTCDAENGVNCDCGPEEYVKNSPLCRYPGPDQQGEQLYAKAYPSVRQLEVLRGVGTQGLVASVCPKTVEAASDDSSADPDYGYNPAIDAIAAALKQRLSSK